MTSVGGRATQSGVATHDGGRRNRDVFRTAAIVPSERPTASGAELVVISGPAMGAHFGLSGQRRFDIGRLPECDVTIDSESVSRHHAVVEATGDGYRVEDKGSTNGTLVNNVRVESAELKDGDLVKIGKAVLKFVASGNLEAAYLKNLVEMTSQDALTGLANRRQFDERLKAEVAKLAFGGSRVGLLLFDIDHFKRINDTFGHPAGDAVLQQLANALRSRVPAEGLLARVGGEEFGVIYPGAVLDAVAELAEILRASVEAEHFAFEGRHIPVTISLGAASGKPGSVTKPEELYHLADAQLYAAKHAGRNCVR